MTILSNCRMVPDLTEGYSGKYADIVYENGLIEGIYPVGMAPSPEGTEVLDIKGMTVLPGLFDLHMHANFDRMIVEQIAVRTPEQSLVDGVDYAQDYLRNGYTFLRDCGIAHWGGRYIREFFDRGLAIGPHYIFSGACNSPRAPGNAQFGPVYREFDGPQHALEICRDDVAHGASFIKYMVTGAMMNEGGDPQAMLCTRKELQAMVDAAAACGTYVAAHCHGKPGILACIEAGVYTVEHSTYLDDECIESYLKSNGKTVMVPTMGVMYGILTDDTGAVPQYMKDRTANIYENLCVNLANACRAGVLVGWGSDADRPSFDRYPGLEFTARKALGLSNIELLRQATVNSAIIAGVIDKAGTIKVGKWADFCIVDGKPDEDIDVMTKLPAHVIIGGQKAV